MTTTDDFYILSYNLSKSKLMKIAKETSINLFGRDPKEINEKEFINALNKRFARMVKGSLYDLIKDALGDIYFKN
ncbi:MAG: hypothetical protein QXL51_07575 [Candidatus Aenigmatarchaeota archaeon]